MSLFSFTCHSYGAATYFHRKDAKGNAAHSVRDRLTAFLSIYFSLLSSFLLTLAVLYAPRATKSEPCERTCHGGAATHMLGRGGVNLSRTERAPPLPVALLLDSTSSSPIASLRSPTLAVLRRSRLRNTVTFFTFCCDFLRFENFSC